MLFGEGGESERWDRERKRGGWLFYMMDRDKQHWIQHSKRSAKDRNPEKDEIAYWITAKQGWEPWRKRDGCLSYTDRDKHLSLHVILYWTFYILKSIKITILPLFCCLILIIARFCWSQYTISSPYQLISHQEANSSQWARLANICFNRR